VLSTILNTLLMSVLEREHELAVLVALGTTRARLGVMVALEAVWMAALGCLAGVTVGGAVSGWVQVYGWDLSTLYGDGMTISGLAISPVVHCRVTPSILAAIAAAVFTATVALALVPVRRAIRVSPAQCLR
jgi:ABC-type lipoprotein release transport system permease subunit